MPQFKDGQPPVHVGIERFEHRFPIVRHGHHHPALRGVGFLIDVRDQLRLRQHSVAVALLHGPPPRTAFEPGALDRPAIAGLRRLATVKRDDAYTAAYPRHFGTAVAVTTTDGRRVEARVDDAWGDGENPMSADAILAKFRTLAADAGVSDATADRLVAAASALADDAPVAPLRAALADAFSQD